jgi:hypothetical protein
MESGTCHRENRKPWQSAPVERAEWRPAVLDTAAWQRGCADAASRPNVAAGQVAEKAAAIKESLTTEILPTAPFVAGSETSHAAAVRADSFAEGQRARVLAYITAKGHAGCTDDEGEVALELPSQSYCPRRRELEKDGLIFKSSLRRETRTGSHAFAYCIRQTETQTDLL